MELQANELMSFHFISQIPPVLAKRTLCDFPFNNNSMSSKTAPTSAGSIPGSTPRTLCADNQYSPYSWSPPQPKAQPGSC